MLNLSVEKSRKLQLVIKKYLSRITILFLAGLFFVYILSRQNSLYPTIAYLTVASALLVAAMILAKLFLYSYIGFHEEKLLLPRDNPDDGAKTGMKTKIYSAIGMAIAITGFVGLVIMLLVLAYNPSFSL